MLEPADAHIRDEQHAHGVTIPDFPGCFSAADEWEEFGGQHFGECLELFKVVRRLSGLDAEVVEKN